MPPTKKPAPTPGNSRTLEEAHIAERKLTAIGEKTYGIVGNPPGAGEYFSEEDMILNGFTEGNLLIRMKPGVDNPTSASIASHGEYQSVDVVLDTIAKAYQDNADQGAAADLAVSRLLSMLNPGISDGAVMSRKMAMSGVQSRLNKAIRLAFGDDTVKPVAKDDPIVDPGPG